MEKKDIQTIDFNYFVKHHDELVEKYEGLYIAIHNKKVIAQGQTIEETLKKALDTKVPLGEFIIQLCTPGDEGYTEKYFSRAIFA